MSAPLAAEIVQSGRPVILSVGEHVRLPRTYRGRDILWWMEMSGVWNQRYDELDDLTRDPGGGVHAVGDGVDRDLGLVERGPQPIEHSAADLAVQLRDAVGALCEPEAHDGHV